MLLKTKAKNGHYRLKSKNTFNKKNLFKNKQC